MSNLNLIKPRNVQGIINKFCYTIGMIPTSYKVSLTYEEQILAIGKYLEETVYPAINNNAHALAELQELFAELQDFVENYFDNLDVQEEINNKLDEMSESGQLQELITSYINLKSQLCFDTVADMKLATNLQEGTFVKTFGFHTLNDCGGASYKIREITELDTINETSLISLLDDTLVAEFIKDKTNHINVNQMGAYGDGIQDDSDAIQAAFDISNAFDIIEFACNNKYKITKTIYSLLDRNIYGNNAIIYQDEGEYNEDFILKYNIDENNNTISRLPQATAEIKNLIVIGRRSLHEKNNFINLCQQVEIHHCRFENINKGIYFTNDYIDRTDIHHIYCNTCANDNTYFIHLGQQGDNKYVHDSQMGGDRTIGSLNFITCGTNLMNLVIERLVACSLDIYSPATIKNIMLSYYCDIILHNFNFIIENIRLSKNKENKYRIKLLNSNPDIYKPTIEINNLKALFVDSETDYSTSPLPCIYLENCLSYKFTNVFTGIRNGSGYLNSWHAFEKIAASANVNIEAYNDRPQYFNGKTVINTPNIGYEKNKVNKVGIGNISLSEYIEFKGDNTNYYYAVQTLLENNFTSDLSQISQITVSDNNSPYLVLSQFSNVPYSIRLLRGKVNGVFTHYVDLTLIEARIIDNGISANGIAWKEFDEPVNEITNNLTCTKIKAFKNYDKLNKIYYCNHSPLTNPSYFTNEFTEGDIVYMNVSPFSKFVYDGTDWNELY